MPAASDREIPQGRGARAIALTRSVLYLPASNPRAIEKARGLNPDAVILDLVDSSFRFTGPCGGANGRAIRYQ